MITDLKEIEILQEAVNKYAFAIYEMSKSRKSKKLPIKGFWTDFDEIARERRIDYSIVYSQLEGTIIYSPLNQRLEFGSCEAPDPHNGYVTDVDIFDM